jgi:hypothetical protein
VKRKKVVVLSKFSKNLGAFYPELNGHFMCPTCLQVFPLDQRSKISDAHIVPLSAGGGEKTYACKKCNSQFGSKQDKWMGEYVRLVRRKESIFHTSLKKNYLGIGGIRAGGTFERKPDGSFDFVVIKQKMSPETFELIKGKFEEGQRSGRITVTVPLPLLENQHLINIGFLTSAYLLWFKELGHSWVLQNHLQSIRDQILNPHEKIIPPNFLSVCKDIVFDKPSLGVTYIRDELALVMSMANCLVFLPPVDSEQFYSKLGRNFDNCQITQLKFSIERLYDTPLGVVFGDRLIIAADPILKGTVPANIILFPSDSDPPRLLRPISDEKAKEVEQLPNVRHVSIRPQIETPEKETGRVNKS